MTSSYTVFRPGERKKRSKDDEDEEVEKEIRAGARTAYDAQRARLERLMKDPAKPVHIPQARKEKDVNKAPDFVYNVMGSSAGAGSGEFHVYRNIRRKEYERQRVLDERKNRDDLDDAFQIKREENIREAEERTAKKRAKRQKKKLNAKKNKQNKPKQAKPSKDEEASKEDSDSSENESEKDEEDKTEPTEKKSKEDN